MVTNKVYYPDTGRIKTIKPGPGDSVQNVSFGFNTIGNLIERIDAVAQVTDTTDYDDLNRLTEVVTSNPSLPLNVTKTVAYDAIGNITNKSDVGDYTLHNGRGGDGGPQTSGATSQIRYFHKDHLGSITELDAHR